MNEKIKKNKFIIIKNRSRNYKEISRINYLCL